MTKMSKLQKNTWDKRPKQNLLARLQRSACQTV